MENKKNLFASLNMPRYLLCVVAGFIALSVLEYVFHMIILAEHYQATASLWRPPEEMMGYSSWSAIVMLGFSAVLAFIFTRNYEDGGIPEGIRFGVMIGLLLGIPFFGMYAVMPIPIELAGAWFAGIVVEMTLVGILFSLLYKN